MTRSRSSPYINVIDLDDVPNDKLRNILGLLLDHLNLQIVEEATPDYTVYELEEKSDG
jgi:hypothetical protein